MDDAIRQQAIEALNPFAGILQSYETADDRDDVPIKISHLRRAKDALTALKAIQPRPDVVVAARDLYIDALIMAEQILDASKSDTRWLGCYEKVLPRIRACQAALADEQEWEVLYAFRRDATNKVAGPLCDYKSPAPEGSKLVPVYIPKAKPKQVSREQAIEDALRDLEMEAALSSSVPSATVSKAITAFRAALSRVRETG